MTTQNITNYTILGNPRFINNRYIISSYKRSLTILKIFSFLGIFLVLYFIYINTSTLASSVKLAENIADEQKLLLKDDNTEYEAKISNSTFKGVNDKLHPYQIHTSYATKTLDNGYAMQGINAQYEINKEQLLVITAKNGIMNGKTQILKLNNDVVFTLGEAILKAQNVEFNLANKETFSNTGVILDYKHSKISATNFRSREDNNLLHFKDKVSTIIDISDF